MIIKMMRNDSEPHKVGKTLVEVVSLTGTLRAETSIIDPVIVINGTITADKMLTGCNYMYIPDFGRYYFIKNIVSVRNNAWQITAHVDVLETYQTQIKQQTAVIRRQENKYNLYLDDGVFKTYQNPNIVTKAFPAGFNSQAFILAVAGD